MNSQSIAFTTHTHTGAFDLTAAVRYIGQDLLVAIWGGESPHIGAVAVAQARPSLRDSHRISATASVICLLGHKEDDIVKAAAIRLAADFNTTAVVTAGMHWEDIDADGIDRVIENNTLLIELVSRELKQRMEL